jgi:hypothetical protein
MPTGRPIAPGLRTYIATRPILQALALFNRQIQRTSYSGQMDAALTNSAPLPFGACAISDRPGN